MFRLSADVSTWRNANARLIERACTRISLIGCPVIDEASVGHVERVVERDLRWLEQCHCGLYSRDRGIGQIGGNDYTRIGRCLASLFTTRTGALGARQALRLCCP